MNRMNAMAGRPAVESDERFGGLGGRGNRMGDLVGRGLVGIRKNLGWQAKLLRKGRGQG